MEGCAPFRSSRPVMKGGVAAPCVKKGWKASQDPRVEHSGSRRVGAEGRGAAIV